MLSCSAMSDSATPWTAACQTPLFMGILQARIRECLAMPSIPGDLPDPGPNPGLLHCRQTLYPLRHQGSPLMAAMPDNVGFPAAQWSKIQLPMQKMQEMQVPALG